MTRVVAIDNLFNIGRIRGLLKASAAPPEFQLHFIAKIMKKIKAVPFAIAKVGFRIGLYRTWKQHLKWRCLQPKWPCKATNVLWGKPMYKLHPFNSLPGRSHMITSWPTETASNGTELSILWDASFLRLTGHSLLESLPQLHKECLLLLQTKTHQDLPRKQQTILSFRIYI